MSCPAVLIVAFNRPETTRRVFTAVRAARPAQLFFACDAPRPDRPGETERVAAVRDLLRGVDWPCEVHTRFPESNLGCGPGVSSAITWFLGEAGEGIILEDDCLPTPAFFRFAAAMLERHRDEPKVALISGSNMAPLARFDGEYAFSAVSSCWGWATWKRTWDDYRLRVTEIAPEETWAQLAHPRMVKKLSAEVRRIAQGDAHTWDYQLLVQCLRRGQLTVVPRWNLVLNIGFDGSGAHYNSGGRPWAVPEELHDPETAWARVEPMSVNAQYDAHYLACFHRGSSILYRQWLKWRHYLLRRRGPRSA